MTELTAKPPELPKAVTHAIQKLARAQVRVDVLEDTRDIPGVRNEDWSAVKFYAYRSIAEDHLGKAESKLMDTCQKNGLKPANIQPYIDAEIQRIKSESTAISHSGP